MQDREMDLGKLKSALEQEGLTFYPKRQLDIPTLSPSEFANPKLRNKVEVLLNFFKLTLIGDMWGADDQSRQVWESGLIKKYGKDVLSEMIGSKNSFRGNALGKVMWMSRDIRNMLGEMGMTSTYEESLQLLKE